VLHLSKMESKIKASAAQVTPRTSHSIPMPSSCHALSLLTLSADSQERERSRTFLFSGSFDPRGFINNSIPCRLFPGDLGLTLKKSDCPVQCFSIGHAMVSSEAFSEGSCLRAHGEGVKSCFDFGIRSPAFGGLQSTRLDIHVNVIALQDHGECFDGFNCWQ
jgi:hypothetical protein